MTTTHSPLISVVIPTCGRPAMLLDCVTSIISGRYDNFEILVIDQDPKSGLQDQLLQRFAGDKRLRYFCLNQAGLSRSKNFGTQEARSEIVAFIDDDALADPLWLEAIQDIFSSVDASPDLITGRIEPILPGKWPEWYPQEREFLLGLYNIGDNVCPMPPHDTPIGANMAGSRQVIQALGGFDERLGFNHFRKHPMIPGEDALLGKRARQAECLMYYHPLAKVFHRVSAVKFTKRHFIQRHFWEGMSEIIQMHLLNQLGSSKLGHLKWHAKTVIKSFMESIFPDLYSRTGQPRSSRRMLSLSRAAQSLGIIYALLTLSESAKR